jgi:HD superfamily phosphohydrolase YqeK
MAPLTKLVFIADYIEPTRGYDDTAEMYNLAFLDIDKVIQYKYAEIKRIAHNA